MASLTRDEAITRAGLLEVTSMEVALDLTTGAEQFGSVTTIRFGCREPGSATFVELNPVSLAAIRLNGRDLDPGQLDDRRFPLTDLAADNVLVVEATMAYSRDGQGLHRSVDPADERAYVYGHLFLDAAPSVFACFDQPDLKAPYAVTVTAPEDWVVIGNGAETREGAVWTLASTKPLATYFVTVCAGPYVVERDDHDGIPLAIYGRASLEPQVREQAAQMFEVTKASFDYYHGLFGIRYPFGKYDQVFVPEFNAGAMENPGCVTFRDTYLFRGAYTREQLTARSNTIAHEMAHMWFGDLVTMKWWNGIWLNEAFATFMEIACCDAYRPDWLRWTTFSLERSAAFEVDSLASTRTVEYPVEAPADCDGMFDVLTYQKGGSLLRMLEQYLTPERFQLGVSHYLSKHEYSNTETSDLWDAIEEANDGTPVRQLMDSWIWQAGYPLVSARQDGGDLVLSQQRFAYGETADATLFVVPVHLRIDGVASKVLLDGFDLRVQLPTATSSAVVNFGGHGYMRVSYDTALRSRLVTELDTLTIVDRYNLVDDAWNEVVAGRLAADDFLSFVEVFAGNRELAVWQAIAIGLRGVGRLVEGDAFTALQRRVAALVGPAVADLGSAPVEGEGDLVAKLRGLLTGTLAVLGNDAETQARCRTIVAEGKADPELIAAATNAVAAHGTDADYDEFLTKFRTAGTPQEQLRYLYALAEFPEAAQIERSVQLAFSGEVRTQNAPFLLNRCIANRHHGAAAWQSVRKQWDTANEKFPGSTIVRMIDPVKLLTAPAVVADVQSFFSEHPIPQGAKTLEQVLERQRVNAALREREAVRLSAALLG